jgi:hypothetical protein
MINSRGSSATLGALSEPWRNLGQTAAAELLQTLWFSEEGVPKQAKDVANLEANCRRGGLQKPAQKAALHMRGVGQNQNEGNRAYGNKNKDFEKLSKNQTNKNATNNENAHRTLPLKNDFSPARQSHIAFR